MTEGRNTGFKKILDALNRNGSPLPEFETDEAHDYFITRLFVREGFYDYQNGAENGVENGVELLSEMSRRRLAKLTPKKRKTAERILAAIMDNPQITIAQMTADTGIANRTIQRYLSELRAMEVLKREGSDTSGKWVLM